jgi:predicted transcriptional regulator
MRTFTFKLGITSFNLVREKLLNAAATGVPYIREHEMTCGSVRAMTDAISRSKLETFAAIVQHQPSSLRELAKILDKDEGNLSREITGLELIGLIKIEKRSDIDARINRPIALYDQIAFDFRQPKKLKPAR